MIFYIHYILLTSGLSGTSVLLGVFLQSYSDASQAEIGFLLMTFPFVCLFVKPLFCSLADRYQAHKRYLVMSMILMLIGYFPYVLVPFFPQFYESHKRFCWWLFFWAGQMGNCALGVAWSLGDSLAVNYAHRKGAVYSRMRLMGTVSWGVYGYIIGLINELPFLPKYVPSFLTLYFSVILEIFIVLLWNDDDFRMVEPEENKNDDDILMDNVDMNQKSQFIGLIGALDKKELPIDCVSQINKIANEQQNMLESSPKKSIKLDCEDQVDNNNNTLEDLNNNSSINCNLIDDQVKSMNCVALDRHDDLDDFNCKLTSSIDQIQPLSKSSDISLFLVNENGSNITGIKQQEQKEATGLNDEERSLSAIKRNYIVPENLGGQSDGLQKPDPNAKHVNYQLLLFKMIFKVDVRLIKYLIFFTLAGFVLAPMSFLFISVSQECEKQKDCNFSRLAGYILICQASIETCCFLLVPFLQKMVGNLSTLVIGLTSMSLRYLFYSFGYYDTGISVQWAILGECLHGICFGIYCTLMAEYALSFANQSRLFIPELRRQGLLTEPNDNNRKQVEAEEGEIKVALRATMQATFGGCMDGLGQGLGLLACGLIADHYNYVVLWKFFLIVTLTTLVGYFMIEITRTRWSDRSRVKKIPEISSC